MTALFGSLAIPATADDAGGGAQVGGWKTWVLASSTEIQPPPPPADSCDQTAAELAELRRLQSQRDSVTNTTIHYYNSVPAMQRWTELTLSLVQRDRVNPVRTARIRGHVHAAISDAVVATWRGISRGPSPCRKSPPTLPIVQGD